VHGLRHPVLPPGLPLGNLIPDWNDLVYRDRWQPAIDRPSRDQQFFPSGPGACCPAPCEGSCVLGINDDPSQSSRSK
jgi:glutamate synthase (NADPH/NADH) small chain